MFFFKKNPIPDARGAAARLLILRRVVVYAMMAPPMDLLEGTMEAWPEPERVKFLEELATQRDEFWGTVKKLGIWKELAPSEVAFAATTAVTMSPQQRLDASWRLESVQVLGWALGLLDELTAWDRNTDPELLKELPACDPKGARLRPMKELEKKRSLAQLWHWRSRTRMLMERGDVFPSMPGMEQLGIRNYDDMVRFTAKAALKEQDIPEMIEEDFPAFGKAYRDLNEEEWSEIRSITLERHFCLNWLCGHSPKGNWDETPTDT